MNTHGYDRYDALRSRLAQTMDGLAGTLERQGALERAARLREGRAQLQREIFRLLVVGEFKRGKSTLINAMLGQDVLPAKVAPCTGLVTELKYAEAPRAVLHPKEGAPMEVPVDALRQYVVIEEDDDDEAAVAAAVAGQSHSHLELFYPLRLLEQGVELVDSPGLNEHQTRTRVALDAMARADALIMVLSCQQALTASELSFIDQELGGRNLRHVFFVWNHADALAGDTAEREALAARSAELLEPRIGTGERIFYLSAREALAARKQQGTDAAMQGFEAALERFLSEERGRAKLLTPLRMAESAVREGLQELLPRREAYLEAPVQALRERYEAQRPRLEELERKRERLLRSIERRRDALVAAVGSAYQAFVVETEQGLREQVAAIEVGTWEAIASRRRSQELVSRRLEEWLTGHVRQWQEGPLEQLFESHMQALEADVEAQSREFLDSLEAIRAAMAPEVRVEARSRISDVNAADRVLSAVGGFFVGGVGAAIEGASHGFRGMSRGIVLHIGIGIALSVFGAGFLAFPLMAAVGIGRSMWEAGQVAQRLREQAASDMAEQLRQRMPEMTQAASLRVGEAFDRLMRAVDGGMRVLIDEVHGQMKEILEAREEGEAALARARKALAEDREALQALSRQLDTVRFELEAQPVG